MKQKIKFAIGGETYELTPKYRYGDNIIIGQQEVCALTKQFIKRKYPQLKVWVKSDSYSGGCSATIWICNGDATQVDTEIFMDIKNFAEGFQQGNFNGMDDIYEFTNFEDKTDDGFKFTNYTKYVFVNNRPKSGSVEDLKLSLIKMMEGGYEGGPKTLEESIRHFIKWGYDTATVQKAAQLV